MKVLVLGGNRYIGRNLVAELAEAGHEVTVFNSHESDLPQGVRRLHGNRHEPGVLDAVLGPHRDSFDAVYDNTSYNPDHLAPVVDLFRGRVRHFVFTSSIGVYPWSDVLPVNETDSVAQGPDPDGYGPYGHDKVRCEVMLAAERDSNSLPFTVMRVSHSLGPQSPLVTREPGTFRRIELGRPLLLAGRSDAIVHFVHVRDAASALVAVLGKDIAAGRTYNVAGRDYCSVSGYMRLMAEAAGHEARIIQMPPGLPGHMRSPVGHWLEARHGSMIFSTEAIRRDLGWELRFDLRSGLADSWRWFNEGGRDRYTYDFTADDEILAELERRGHDGSADEPSSDGVRIFSASP
jgi:nucleoside-diphosphate-sugar epimerase